MIAINKHSAGTDDSVYPSDEYKRILRGRDRAWTGVGGWIDTDDELVDGDVMDRIRAGWGGRGALGGGVGAGFVELVSFPLELPIPGKEGNEGIRAVTDDQRLELVDAGAGTEVDEGGGFDVKTGGGGGGGGVIIGTGNGWIHFSKNLTIGMSETIVAWVFAGELGNGRWMTAFA